LKISLNDLEIRTIKTYMSLTLGRQQLGENIPCFEEKMLRDKLNKAKAGEEIELNRFEVILILSYCIICFAQYTPEGYRIITKLRSALIGGRK
jgi:hypothetical protein